jgi:protein gp37
VSSKIEWTDETWNPVTGCTQVSPGCDHCYAKTWAARQMGPWKGRAFEDVRCHEDRLDLPLRKRKPTRFFVNSMSDLFHKDVPDDFIKRVFETMLDGSLCPHRHTFQVLTKRPERMRRLVPKIYDAYGQAYRDGKPYIDRIWLCVSIESSAYAWRADMLRGTPSTVRGISMEPMIDDCRDVDFTGMNWVIFGGESGPGARLCDPAWIAKAMRRAQAAGAAVFVKQLGAVWSKSSFAPEGWRGDPKGGDIDRFPSVLRVREFPAVSA